MRVRMGFSVFLTILAILSLACFLSIVGCSGRKTLSPISSTLPNDTPVDATRGQATFTITWPVPSGTRLIPTASNSIVIKGLQGPQVVVQKVVSRPSTGNTTTVRFSEMTAGSYSFQAAAYPSTDGTGVAQALGTVPVEIRRGETTSTTLVMGSTITRLVLSPATINLDTTDTAGIDVTATAYDASNAVVLTSGSVIDWSASPAGLVNFSTLQGIQTHITSGGTTGSVTITAREREASVSGTSTVSVTRPASTDWDTFQGNAGHTGYVPMTVNPANFREKWVANLTNAALNHVAIGSDSIFAAGSSFSGTKILFSVNQATGTTRWSYDFGSIYTLNAPSHADGVVYATTGSHSDSYVWAFDALTGAPRFRSAYQNQSGWCEAPVILNRRLYMNGGYYGGAYCFDTTNGSQVWFNGLTQYEGWTPMVQDNAVFAYVGGNSSGDGQAGLRALDISTGQELYRILDPCFTGEGYGMEASPILGSNNNVLFTQNSSGRLVNFDLAGRRIAWVASGNFARNGAVVNGHIYIVGTGQLESRSEVNGSLEWIWIPPNREFSDGPIIATTNLVFISTNKATYAIDQISHQMVWSYPKKGKIALSKKGELIIAGADGKLVDISLGL
jgi:outer membrane protein assembly factor BamB